MEKRQLLLATALTLFTAVSASGQTATTSIFGKWQVDRQKSIDATLARDKTAAIFPHDEQTTSWYEFMPDGKLTATAHRADGTLQGKQSGDWRVLSEAPGELKLELLLLDEEGRKRLKLPAMIQFIDSKTAQFDIKGCSETVVLVKAR